MLSTLLCFQVWTATIVGISAVCATRSLFFEFTTLVARPAPEALVGAVLNAGFNLVSHVDLIDNRVI